MNCSGAAYLLGGCISVPAEAGAEACVPWYCSGLPGEMTCVSLYTIGGNSSGGSMSAGTPQKINHFKKHKQQRHGVETDSHAACRNWHCYRWSLLTFQLNQRVCRCYSWCLWFNDQLVRILFESNLSWSADGYFYIGLFFLVNLVSTHERQVLDPSL